MIIKKNKTNKIKRGLKPLFLPSKKIELLFFIQN